MTKKDIDISLLEELQGQIPNVPANPRTITHERLAKLKQSLIDDPEMLNLRELIVYPHNGRYVVLGGNMRLKALRKIDGISTVPCKVLAADTPPEKMRAIVIKDNNAAGTFDEDKLTLWQSEELMGWLYDYTPPTIPETDISTIPTENIVKESPKPTIPVDENIQYGNEETPEPTKRKYNGCRVNDRVNADKGEKEVFLGEANYKMQRRDTVRYFTIIDSVPNGSGGTPLSEFKAEKNVVYIEERAERIVRELLGGGSGWAIASAPKRKHYGWHFATEVGRLLAERMGVPFYEELILAKTKSRMHPEFVLGKKPEERNLIIFDDIVTTCMTLLAYNELLRDKGYNVLNIIGVNNK